MPKKSFYAPLLSLAFLIFFFEIILPPYLKAENCESCEKCFETIQKSGFAVIKITKKEPTIIARFTDADYRQWIGQARNTAASLKTALNQYETHTAKSLSLKLEISANCASCFSRLEEKGFSELRMAVAPAEKHPLVVRITNPAGTWTGTAPTASGALEGAFIAHEEELSHAFTDTSVTLLGE